LHPRTWRNIKTFGLADLASRLSLAEPLDYPVLLTLIRHTAGLVTDSGGIQEEGTILKRPILVVRRSNERPEVERAFGRRMLPGDDGISRTIATWLRDAPAINARLADLRTPFGDGTASSRVVQAVRSRFGGSSQPHSTEVREA
jgi:UDP-N-acetylglucosamine 2-epimerase (non-hydrolysing)